MTDEAYRPKVGDIVRLKSGGPKMTVTYSGETLLTGRWSVSTQWFAGPTLHTLPDIDPDALEPAGPSAGGVVVA